MTEYELLDLTGVTATFTMTAISLYLTVISAYLYVAFSAGAKLSKSQAFTVSILFVVASGLFIRIAVMNLVKQSQLVDRLKELQSDGVFFTSESSAVILAIVLMLGVVASLKFMWEIRHPKPE